MIPKYKDGGSSGFRDLLDIRSLLHYSFTKLGNGELRAMCESSAGPDAFAKIKGSV